MDNISSNFMMERDDEDEESPKNDGTEMKVEVTSDSNNFDYLAKQMKGNSGYSASVHDG